MKCPTCGENTPDAWQPLLSRTGTPQRPSLSEMPDPDLRIRDARPHEHQVQFDRMHCANRDCGQLVIRGHDSWMVFDNFSRPTQTTDTWVAYPRRAARPLDPLIARTAESLARDFGEAVAILDFSHRMSAVLARSLLADLLEAYAGLDQFSLAARIDKFVADQNRPFDLREGLHYLREIADLSAHTKTNDQFEKIEITREEAEWTLSVIERLFNHFIVSPAKFMSLRKGMDAKLEAAGRKPIEPLLSDGEVASGSDD